MIKKISKVIEKIGTSPLVKTLVTVGFILWN